MAVSKIFPLNLSAMAVHILTVLAIKNRTWAMERVFLSPSTPADIRVQEEREPFIGVYVDDGNFMAANEGEMADITLIIEVSVASPRQVAGSSPAAKDDHMVTEINATDEGLEIQIGLLCRQVLAALEDTDPSNPFAHIWRDFAFDVSKSEFRRGGPGQEGEKQSQRYASRIMFLHCNIAGEPPRGVDPMTWPTWAKFFAAIETDPDYAGTGRVMRAHIAPAGSPIPSWREAQKEMGLSDFAARSIGINPLEGHFGTGPGPDEAPPLAKVEPVRQPAEGFDPWRGLDLRGIPDEQ